MEIDNLFEQIYNLSNLFEQIYNLSNLILAWRKARKGKSKKKYVLEFEKDTLGNLLKLQEELKNQTYKPKPLVTFVLRDPKTRVISKSDFRDRIIHHAVCNIIEPIFDNSFIYDSCANRIGKGSLFALERFELFKRKVTNNLKAEAFYLKADIKHYFEEVNHDILISIIERKIKNEKVIWLIRQILNNNADAFGGGASDFARQTIIYINERGREQKEFLQERNASWQFNKPILC